MRYKLEFIGEDHVTSNIVLVFENPEDCGTL